MLTSGNIGKYSTHLTPTFKWGEGSDFQKKTKKFGVEQLLKC